MGIQSSVNALMQQLYTIGAIGAGLREQKKQTKGQEKTANEAQIQTEIAAGNAPIKDGKVDTEWLKKRRDIHNQGMLTNDEKKEARILGRKIKRGIELDPGEKQFYNNPIIQEYLKSSAANSLLKNKVASDLARASVEARTASINKTKSNFDEHTASLIRYYGKGSGNP